MELTNPFRPTAGAEPPVLIGRDKVLRDFSNGLREGVGAPARLMRITGPRGSGKTVLLTELGDMARARGWRVVDVTSSEHLVQDIMHELEEPARKDVEIEASIGIIKAQATVPGAARAITLRDALTHHAGALTKRNAGLLVTIDEIQDAREEEVREIATSVQHLIRERMNIAFVFAGITTGVMDLINGKALTFLRRAKSEELQAIPLDEVTLALRASIERSGMSIAEDALQTAAAVTEGYAFLIQLVGYHVWTQAYEHAATSKEITLEDAQRGIEDALEEFNDTVLETAIAGLPLRAVEYLLAMSKDSSVSSTARIAERLQTAPTSLTSYRRLLIKRQVIEPTARGFVAFSIPYMREFFTARSDAILARYGVE